METKKTNAAIAEEAARKEKGAEEHKPGRGGRREGAGRKATGRLRKAIQITLPEDVSEALKEVGNKSLYIERLIRQEIEKRRE